MVEINGIITIIQQNVFGALVDMESVWCQNALIS